MEAGYGVEGFLMGFFPFNVAKNHLHFSKAGFRDSRFEVLEFEMQAEMEKSTFMQEIYYMLHKDTGNSSRLGRSNSMRTNRIYRRLSRQTMHALQSGRACNEEG